MLLVWVSSVTEIKPKKARLPNHFGFHPSCSSTYFPVSWFPLAFVVLVNMNACQTLSHNLRCALALFWLFVHPPTHTHIIYLFFLTWCVQGILDLCKQVRIYLSVEMPNGAKWQRRRLVLKINLSDGFLSNVVFWSI